MIANVTLEEHKFLVEADNEIAMLGKTEKRCPRCGNEIIIEEEGNSYSVKCKTPNCIHADFRGI